MNRKMTLTEPDHIRHAREASVRWLLEPSKKTKISFTINPRTEVTTVSYTYSGRRYYYSNVRVPFEDYDEDNLIKYTSGGSKYEIIDEQGNFYSRTGETLENPIIYSGYWDFQLEEGVYFYHEVESGTGNNLITEDVKIQVKQGMAKIINIDHDANEYRLYFNQECMWCDYDFVKDFDIHLSDKANIKTYYYLNNIEVTSSFEHCNYSDLKRYCKIRSVVHNDKPVDHKLTFINNRIFWGDTSYVNYRPYEITDISTSEILPGYYVSDVSRNFYEGLQEDRYSDNVGYTFPDELGELSTLQDYSSGCRTIDFSHKGSELIEWHYRIDGLDAGEPYYEEENEEVVSDGKIEIFPIKNGFIYRYETTEPVIRTSRSRTGTDEYTNDTKWGSYIETEKRALCETSRCSVLLTKAIETAEKEFKIGTPILILDSNKKHQFNAYRYPPARGSETQSLYYEYIDDSEITSMYFSAVNAVNTIREEQNNE